MTLATRATICPPNMNGVALKGRRAAAIEAYAGSVAEVDGGQYPTSLGHVADHMSVWREEASV